MVPWCALGIGCLGLQCVCVGGLHFGLKWSTFLLGVFFIVTDDFVFDGLETGLLRSASVLASTAALGSVGLRASFDAINDGLL